MLLSGCCLCFVYCFVCCTSVVVLPHGIVVVVFTLVDFLLGKAFVKTAACLLCTRICISICVSAFASCTLDGCALGGCSAVLGSARCFFRLGGGVGLGVLGLAALGLGFRLLLTDLWLL